MKKIIVAGPLFAFLLTAASFFAWMNSARAESSCNDHVVISQIYGGGGNSGAPYRNDFVELYNPTDRNILLENWSLQYVSATGSFPATSTASTVRSTLLHGEIKPGNYYLIQENSNSDEGQPLEDPDTTGFINLAANKGRIALVDDITLINSESDSSVVDLVIYDGGNNTKSVYREIKSCSNALYADTPNPRNSNFTATDGSNESTDDNNEDPAEKCATTSSDIRLNEIFPYPSAGEEFTEVVNTGGSCVDISGWKIMDEAGHKKEFPENSTMGPGEYLFLEGNLYLNNGSDTIYLLGKNGSAKSDALDSRNFEKARKDFSYSYDGEGWQWTSAATPGDENVITTSDSDEGTGDADSGENYPSDENVYLNEILPNPKKDSDDEYIEIVNGESGPVDLYKWMIRDGSKSGKYVFKEHMEIGPGEYLAIYKSESKIALNNSSDSVYLYNPKNEIVSSVSFDKSAKNSSYNFDGKNWHWSKYLTPGKKNKLDSPPAVKIKKIKRAYKGIYTKFSAKAKDKEMKKLKYVWDFGDGKKSYLKKTSHKYLDTGKYTVTLSVSDDSQTIEKSFTIAVKNYPRPDLEIVKIIPNPAGNDSKGETINIKNNSGKKIDLQGWKIATGSGEKMYNHPISDGITLDPGETKDITREMSRFALNNKAGKVQLVSPDGKTVDEVEYAKEKIAEDEAYVKIDGEWQWVAQSLEKEPSKEEDFKEESGADGNGDILGAADENNLSARSPIGYTLEDEFIFYKAFGFADLGTPEINSCSANNFSFSIAYILALVI